MQYLLKSLNACVIYTFIVITFTTFFLFIPTGALQNVFSGRYSPQLLASAGMGFSIITLFSLYFFRKALLNILCQANQQLNKVNPLYLMLTLIIIGVAIRIAYTAFMGFHQTFDEKTYISLAHNLAFNSALNTNVNFNYWPIGYPLYLAFFFKLLGNHMTTILISNLCLYVVTLLSVYRLSYIINGELTAKYSALLLFLWPNYAFSAGLALKEEFCLFLLTFFMLIYLLSTRCDRKILAYIMVTLSGLCLGWLMLSRPVYMILPIALLIFELNNMSSYGDVIKRFLFIILGMSIVFVPYTIRNYIIFNKVMVTTTNSGINLQIGNNPQVLSMGHRKGSYNDIENYYNSYLPVTNPNSTSRELELQAGAYKNAFNWISENPLEFLKMFVWHKPKHYLYASITAVRKSMYDKSSGVNRLIFFGSCSVFWYGLWALILLLCIKINDIYKINPKQKKVHVLFFLTLLFPLIIHSIYFGEDRFNYDATGLLIIIASLVFTHYPMLFKERARNNFLFFA